MNILLLKLLTEEEYYNKYRDYININKNTNTEEEKIIIKLIDYIFKNKIINNNKYINKELLLSLLEDNYNNILNKETKNNIINIINNIYNTSFSEEKEKENNYNIIIINLLKKYYLENIIQESINILENINKLDLDIIDKYLQEYKQKTNILLDENISLISNDISELLEKEGDTSGYDWFCDKLTQILDKIKGGDLGLVVASVNAGKTAFILTIAMSLIQQGAKVLHINNEERGTKVKLRAIENLCDMNKFEIIENKNVVQEKIDKYMKDNYFLHDLTTVTIRDVKTLIEKHQPDVVIIDQAWKIKVSKQDRNDLTLTEIFKNLREIAKEYNVHIIGTTQADGNAYGKEWIKLDNLFGSKVGVQGELDYIIGIGQKDEVGKEDWRYLSFPKNKLTGNESSKLILKLDKERSKYYVI